MNAPNSRSGVLALSSLLIGVLAPSCSTAAFAQSTLQIAAGLGGALSTSEPDEPAFSGGWAASRGLTGNPFYLELTEMSSGTVWGVAWERRSEGNVKVGSLQLRRTAPDRLTGSFADSDNRISNVVIIAPAGKSYRVVQFDRGTGRMAGAYLRPVRLVGESVDALNGSAVQAAMLGEWNTPLGRLAIKEEDGRISGRFHRADGSTYLSRITPDQSLSTESQRWRIGTDDGGNEFSIVLSPEGNQFQAYDARGRLNGLMHWEANRVAAPRPAPRPAPGPIQPAPGPEPSPAPAPSPNPGADTSQAGIFHQLGVYNVRFDDARAARDGRVQTLFTIRNASGREQSFGAGALVAVISDADGVGVRESQAYRADADEPALFSPSPTIPAGGELRVRYVFRPPTVHGPLQRVSVREYGEKKLLTFALPSSAGPGATPASAPPPGSGLFKQLSEFDVRIDRVAPARDGKLEVFLTLRNPSSLLRSTSKGHIKLSGSDSDGANSTSVSALFSVRGERGRYDELPLHVHVEPRGEVRLRYIFDRAISGPITVSDGTVSQTFTAG